eukprot:scaffold5391_cov171-Amphora_coffeaeformis.AAC.1
MLLLTTTILLASSCAWTPVQSSFRPTTLLLSRGANGDDGDDVMQKFQQAWGNLDRGNSSGSKPSPQQARGDLEKDNNSGGQPSPRKSWGDLNKINRNVHLDQPPPASVPLTNTNTEEEDEMSTVNEESEIVVVAAEQENAHPKLKFSQRIENAKCLFLGTGVGILAVIPFTAFHHFVYQPKYTSIPQWEFDTYTAAIQGALFCLTYRYTLRRAEDLPVAIPKTVIASFIGVRTLSRVHESWSNPHNNSKCSAVYNTCENTTDTIRRYKTIYLHDHRWGNSGFCLVVHGRRSSRKLCRKHGLIWGRRNGHGYGGGATMDSPIRTQQEKRIEPCGVRACLTTGQLAFSAQHL